MLAPETRAIGGVHELGGDDQRVVHPVDSSRHECLHVELAAELSRLQVRHFVARYGAVGEHAQRRHVRKIPDHAVGNTRGQVIERGITRVVLKRQDGDRIDRPVARRRALARRHGFNLADDDPPMQLNGGFFGLCVQLGSYGIGAAPELLQGLRTPAHEHIQRHQCPVRVLVRWRSANQRFKLSDGTLVLMERGVDPTQLHQELFVNRAKLSSLHRAPVGIAILSEQIAAVHPERLFVVGRDARLDGTDRKPLELLHVDPQITR